MAIIKSFDLIVKLLKHNNYDLNRFFKLKIQIIITYITMLGNKEEIRESLSLLSNFEKKINFTAILSIVSKFINFFVLHGTLTIATYMCLFFSRCF